MPKLNKSFVDKVEIPTAKPGKQAQSFYRDDALPGFALRVMNTGTKSFVVEKRIDGKVKRITLGKYPPLTPEKARIKATELLGDITLGKDPIKEKQATKLRGKTLKEAYNDYLESRHDLKPGTIKNYNKCMNGCLSDWLDKPLLDISKDMVQQRHREIGQTAEARANNTMRVLRAVFNHSMAIYEDEDGQAMITVNPVSRLSQSRSWYRVERRTGFIKAHELKPWLDAVESLSNHTPRDYLKVLLYTGLRKSEAANLKWSDIDLIGKTLTVHDTKNRSDHHLPLPPALLSIFSERRLYVDSEWVFPSPLTDGPLVEPRTAIKKVVEQSGVKFTMHDLRRTFLTIAESLDISAYALKRLVNHSMAHDVTAGYIISDVERLRKPMEQIADFIQENIANG